MKDAKDAKDVVPTICISIPKQAQSWPLSLLSLLV